MIWKLQKHWMIHSDKNIVEKVDKGAFFPFSLWIGKENPFNACLSSLQLNQFSTGFAFLVYSTSTFLSNTSSMDSTDWFDIIFGSL